MWRCRGAQGKQEKSDHGSAHQQVDPDIHQRPSHAQDAQPQEDNMTRRLAINQRLQNAWTIRYNTRHPAKRPKGRKLKRLRASLYAKMDRRLARLRSGLNEYTLDLIRLRMPKVRFSVPDCPMMRWK